MRVVERIAPELKARLRLPEANPWPARADRVYVLSRITLGADVAVTSVLMDSAKHRYPDARILFVGPRKNYELFEADARVEHFPAPYARSGSLKDRLAASAALWIDDGLVLDPDSRLTQLGLIRVCPDERYCFFDSRSYGEYSAVRLPQLAMEWALDPLGKPSYMARPYIAPRPAAGEPADITVSLGVGENLDKRVDGEFETELMKLLSETSASVLVDLGGTVEERARVERVLQPGMRVHDGAFAPFAAEIERSQLFVGYDSAGGHVASACGVPVISIAAGFANPRMAARWSPLGTCVDGHSPEALELVREALPSFR
jgi:ADP-heptose:LPS heptosyltransferase